MTIPPEDRWYRVNRLTGLRIFAVAITALNVAGHTVLGFEQSLAQPLTGIGTAYALALGLEYIDARARGRPVMFAGGPQRVVDFLLAPHISGLAIAMLLYANDRLLPIALATAIAIGSKSIIRGKVNGRSRHLINPSNLGIAAVLIMFPWVGIAPPYHFTENISGLADWALPALIIVSGSMLNLRFTKRFPLIVAWLGGFVLQAVVRSGIDGLPVAAGLLPMTGVAFILFTFYMVTDPATTPSVPWRQVAFGAGTAVAYGILMAVHIVFGLFFALLFVSSVRAVAIYARAIVPVGQARRLASPAVAAGP